MNEVKLKADPIKKQFDEEIDSHCNKLLESYRILLSKGIIKDSTTPHEEFLSSVSLENIVSYYYLLLVLIYK